MLSHLLVALADQINLQTMLVCLRSCIRVLYTDSVVAIRIE